MCLVDATGSLQAPVCLQNSADSLCLFRVNVIEHRSLIMESPPPLSSFNPTLIFFPHYLAAVFVQLHLLPI